MLLARVVGHATATAKHPSMEGWRMLIVQPYQPGGGAPDGDPLIAVDSLGAGCGSLVVISSDGQAARTLLADDRTPVRWTVIGIEDEPHDRRGPTRRAARAPRKRPNRPRGRTDA